MNIRRAQVTRKTAETELLADWNLDGRGDSEIATGLPFFDHMLTLFARHSLTDLRLSAKGDLHVDSHHTVEDTGIVLGQALTQALGDKSGLTRYGHFFMPMDETLCRVVLDLSGRPFLRYELPDSITPHLHEAMGGHFPLQLLEEFLRALTVHGGITLHLAVPDGHAQRRQRQRVFHRAVQRPTNDSP